MKISKKNEKIKIDFEENVFFLKSNDLPLNRNWLEIEGILPKDLTIERGMFISENSFYFGSIWNIDGTELRFICNAKKTNPKTHLFYDAKKDSVVLVDIG